MKKLTFIVFISILMQFYTYAAEKISPEISKTEFFFGETIEIVLPVTPEAKVDALFKEKSEVFHISNIEKEKNSIKLEITALKTGAHSIPGIHLTNGTSSYDIEGKTVTIKANTSEDEEKIKDIKKNALAFEEDLMLLWVGIGILGFLIILTIIILLTRKKGAVQEKTIRKKTPYEIAMIYYGAAEVYFKDGDLDQYVDKVTLGVRAYLEAKKSKHFLEMTTKEVEKNLKKLRFESEFSLKIIALLKLGDRFKFADDPLHQKEFESMLPALKDIVESIEKAEGDNDISKS